MFEVKDTGFKTYVQGKTISVDANQIATLLDLQRLASPSYLFPDPNNREFQADEVVTALYGELTV